MTDSSFPTPGEGPAPFLWPLGAACAVACFLFFFVAFFPGTTTWDSFAMWDRALSWRFTDWHHPLMSVLMSAGRLIRDDFSPLLFLQLGLFWAGTYFFACALRIRIGRWALLTFLLGALPFNCSLQGYIQKSPLMTACFLFSFGLLYFLHETGRRPRPWQTALLLVIMFVGAAIRIFSFPGALPLLAMLALFHIRSDQHVLLRFAKALGAATFVLILFFVGDRILVYDVLRAENKMKISVVYRYDLAGIYALTGKQYAPDFLEEGYETQEKMRAVYDEEFAMWRILNAYRNPQTPEELEYLKNQWWLAVRENPYMLIAHRAAAISGSFGVSRPAANFRADGYASSRNKYGMKKSKNPAYMTMAFVQSRTRTSWCMQPWPWALLCLVLGVAALPVLPHEACRRYKPFALLALSGFLYLGIYLTVCYSADARFTIWVTVSSSYALFGTTALLIKDAAVAWRRSCASPEARRHVPAHHPETDES